MLDSHTTVQITHKFRCSWILRLLYMHAYRHRPTAEALVNGLHFEILKIRQMRTLQCYLRKIQRKEQSDLVEYEHFAYLHTLGEFLIGPHPTPIQRQPDSPPSILPRTSLVAYWAACFARVVVRIWQCCLAKTRKMASYNNSGAQNIHAHCFRGHLPTRVE